MSAHNPESGSLQPVSGNLAGHLRHIQRHSVIGLLSGGNWNEWKAAAEERKQQEFTWSCPFQPIEFASLVRTPARLVGLSFVLGFRGYDWLKDRVYVSVSVSLSCQVVSCFQNDCNCIHPANKFSYLVCPCLKLQGRRAMLTWLSNLDCFRSLQS